MYQLLKLNCLALLIILLFFACNSQTSEKPNEPQALIKGAFFNGANGVNFDKDDRLHVVSVTSRLVGIIDTESGMIIDTLTHDEGIEGPDDVAFGPDGSMYVTSILTGEVIRRKPDGSITKQFVAPGVNPITFSDEGRLFVALDFQGDGLYELDPDLQDPPKLLIKELGWLNAFDFGPDGFLYGPIWSKGHIVKIDVNKASLEVIVDDLQTPAAAKFDSKGNLYALDHQSGKIYKIDINTGEKVVVAEGFEGGDNISFNSKDELFLAHAQDGGVYQVDLDGDNHRTLVANSIANAGDVEYVNGQLMVPDILSMKWVDATSGEMTDVYRHMIGAGGMIGPFTIDHENGLLALTTWFSNEVQVWDQSKGSAVSTSHDYIVPINAILADGDLIVAELGMEAGAAKVTRERDGERETLLDASGGLYVAGGLASSAGHIYVADYAKGVIFQVTEAGKKLDSPKVIASELAQPEGLQIAPDGKLVVVETGANQVSAFDLSSGEKSILTTDIPFGVPGAAGMPPTWKFTDVSFDNKGNMYVPSDVDNVIYKVKY